MIPAHSGGSDFGFPATEDRARGVYESFAHTPIGMVCLGLDLQIRWTNDKFREIFGYTGDELLQKTLLDLIHPDEVEKMEARRAKFLAGEFEHQIIEQRFVRSNGKTVWIQNHISLVRDAAGRPEYYVTFYQDITERKKTEEEIRLSKERFVNAFEYAAIGMALVSPQGRWLKVNRAMCGLLGYEQSELLAKTFQDITHPTDLGTDLDYVHQMLEGKISTYQMEKRYFHKQGHIVWVQLNVSLVWDAEGKPLHFISQVQDITERKRAAKQIAEQAELLDKAQDAILVRDFDGRVLFWNKGAERLYGWTREEAVGKKVSDLLGAPASIVEEFTKAVLVHGEWFGEVDQVTRDGRKLTVEARLTLLYDDTGKPKSVLSIKTDISEKKKIEAQFLRAQRMESIGTLAGGIAHDLNNLLSPILIGVDLLKLFGLPEESQKVVADIERSIKRGSNLVKQILTFARGVEGARVSVHLGDVLTEIISIIDNTFPKNIRLETKISRDIWLVPADPTQLNQVLLNLCVNARDAMPEGGTLTFSVYNQVQDRPLGRVPGGKMPNGPCVVVEVSDTGMGIPKENIDKIFDPFFTTKELGKGTGLGLASVLGIVRNHGGAIFVQSEIGKGTTFSIYLPASPAIDFPVHFLAEGESFVPLRGRGEWILMMDAEIAVLTLVRQSLEAFGYQVLTAEKGEEAINLYASHHEKIALILADLDQPATDASTFISALRHINAQAVIAVSCGVESDQCCLKARQMGIRHFIIKPYTTQSLLQFVHGLLQGR